MAGYVYVITYDSPEWRAVIPYAKVGMTHDIDQRIRSLSTGSPIPFVVAGYIVANYPEAKELEIHTALEKLGARIKNEWFRIDEWVLTYFDNMADAIQENRLRELFTPVNHKDWEKSQFREYVDRRNKRIAELEKINKTMRDRLIEIDPMAHKYIEKVSVRKSPFSKHQLICSRR